MRPFVMFIPNGWTIRAWTIALSATAHLFFSVPAFSQTFNQFVGFGDSTIDSGWYRNPATPPNSTNPSFNTDFAIAVTQGGGKATTNPGLMSSEALAGFFGLTAIPANQRGGTNYATGDAMDSLPTTTGNTGAVPTATQIANYLAGNGGVANPNALYVISSGGNDALAASATTATVTTAADALVAAVARLHDAGARYIVVPNLPAMISGNPLLQDYNDALWPGLAAAGVAFVPADVNSVLAAVKGNPAFGFTATGPACTQPAGVTSGWATLCSATSTVSTLVSPTAAQTHLFADNLHLSTAGQLIVADYEYSLVVAPSMISMLAEAPLQTRTNLVHMIENQIPVSQSRNGRQGLSTWLSGDVASLQINNSPGFPNDPGTPAALAAGFDYRLSRDWLVGLVLAGGHQHADFAKGFGGFTQDEFSVSAYSANTIGPVWFDVIATCGAIAYDVRRTVPVGITLQDNAGSTSGTDVSLAGNLGYDFSFGRMTYGPIAGMTLQQVNIDGFSEAGSFTSLGFGSQTRNSAVGDFGGRASVDLGRLAPFVEATWDHEFASTNRQVTASLTTTVAPPYSMPAVQVGSDWGIATVGTTVKLSSNVSGLLAATGTLAQQNVTTYSGQVGLNVSF
jgi:outer membrane lipase/esterase